MKVCDTCTHVHRNESKRPEAWLCARMPWNELDPLTGGEKPPYRYCRDVLRITCPNNQTPCVLFEPLPEHGEVVVSERGNEKSVTFREKETVE